MRRGGRGASGCWVLGAGCGEGRPQGSPFLRGVEGVSGEFACGYWAVLSRGAFSSTRILDSSLRCATFGMTECGCAAFGMTGCGCAAFGITMALRRPHKGMKTGWRRERATTRVAPTTGLSGPIFIAMTGCGWAAFGITMALRRPHKGMNMGWRRERATTRVAPTTGLSGPIFIAISHVGWHRHHGR